MDNPEINPYAAPVSDPANPPLETQTPDGSPGKVRFVFAITLTAIILICGPIASSFAVDDIESIVVSGAILLVAAIALAIAAYPESLRPLTWIALAMIGMVLVCFFVIFVNQWSPSDAQKPIGFTTVVFAVLIQAGWLPVASVLARRKRQRWQPTTENRTTQ